MFLDALVAHDITHVFGVPGGLIHPFFDAVEGDPRVTLIVSKHEQGAAFMADGYARMSGQIAVCAGTSGPGSTNLLTGVACAFADGVPMLVLTGQAVSTSLGRGAAQETGRQGIDIVGMFEPITKYSATVFSPSGLAQHLARALRLARSGRPGPVHLNIPVDSWSRPVIGSVPTSKFVSRIVDLDAVEAAAKLLAEARRPVVLLGSGVLISGACALLDRLTRMLPARFVTSPRAKCMEDHPLSHGVCGFGGHGSARELVLGDEPDLLLVVGSSLGETTSFNFDPRLARNRRLVQLDIDIDRIARVYPVDVALHGDARATLEALLHALATRALASTWTDAEPPPRGEARYSDTDLRDAESRPLTPQRWRRELDAALPEDAVIFSDIGGHMLFNIHHLAIAASQRFVLNLGFGSMGHGTVAPIGASLACPNRPIVAIVGDACFTMNGMDLLTAVEYGLPIVWIVENNQMHGITWHGSARVSGRPMQSIRYRVPLQLGALARAMGLRVWQVQAPGEIGPALSQALAAEAPALIEVCVDPEQPPPLGDRAKTIAGFEA